MARENIRLNVPADKALDSFDFALLYKTLNQAFRTGDAGDQQRLRGLSQKIIALDNATQVATK